MSVAAYRSTAAPRRSPPRPAPPGPPRDTSFTAPSVDVAQAGSWLVNSWSEKSSNDRPGPPRPAALRAPAPSAPAAARSAPCWPTPTPPVATGNAAGRTATTNVAGGNSQLFSVVVSPGTGPHPAHEPATGPVLHDLLHGDDLQLQCRGHHRPRQQPADLHLGLRGRRDGQRCHRLAHLHLNGHKTVTLTVGDGTTTAQTTRTVSPTAAQPPRPLVRRLREQFQCSHY